MFFTSATPAYVVKAPVEIVNTVHENSFGLKRGEISPSSMRELIILLRDLALQVSPEIKELTVPIAREMLLGLNPLLPPFFEAKNKIEQELKEQIQEPDIALLQELFEAVTNIISEIIFISNDRKIDENSPAYNAFLSELISDSTQSGKHFGKEKLLRLFD